MSNLIRVLSNVTKVTRGQQGLGSVPNKVTDVKTDSDVVNMTVMMVGPNEIPIQYGLVGTKALCVIRHTGNSGILLVTMGAELITELFPNDQFILLRTNPKRIKLTSADSSIVIPVEVILHEVTYENRPDTNNIISAENAQNLSQ